MDEQVEYFHIKAWLTMDELGMSTDAIPSPTPKQQFNGIQEKEESSPSSKRHINPMQAVVVDIIDDDDDSPMKRQKLEEDNNTSHQPQPQLTEASLLEWLQNFQNGVSNFFFLFYLSKTKAYIYQCRSRWWTY